MNKKTLHIDTLYLSYNCDLGAYKQACEIIAEKELLYYRKGRHYYDFGFARVGVLDWDICLASNNYPFRIEYNFSYLYQTDLIKNWQQIKLPFQDSFDKYLINRIDYNTTFQSEDSSILDKIYVSPYFRIPHKWYDSSYYSATVNLGTRKSGKTFRLYNKSKELSDNQDLIKCEMLKNVFGSLDNLYSLEVEILRSYIISRTKSKGLLSDFDKIVELAKHLLGSIKYCDWTDKNLALIRSKNYNKIDFEYIAEYFGDIEFLEVKKYQKSSDNLLKVIDNLLSQYNHHDGDTLSFDDLAKLVSMRDKENYIDLTEGKLFNNNQLSDFEEKIKPN